MEREQVMKDLLSSALIKGRKVKLLVEGQSMEPFLKEGDSILLRQVKRNELMVGDVIAFSLPEKKDNAIHRVIDFKKGLIITKGDNNVFPDPPVDFDQIMGKVVKILPETNLESKEWREKSQQIARISKKQYYFLSPLFLVRILLPVKRFFLGDKRTHLVMKFVSGSKKGSRFKILKTIKG